MTRAKSMRSQSISRTLFRQEPRCAWNIGEATGRRNISPRTANRAAAMSAGSNLAIGTMAVGASPMPNRPFPATPFGLYSGPSTPMNSPELKDFPSAARFTLKIRVGSDQPLPRILGIHALTDSTLAERIVRVAWAHPTAANFQAESFNGRVAIAAPAGKRTTTLRVETVKNSDPNTFDRTLVTITNGTNVFTFKVDDLDEGALFLPEFGAAILPENDHRDYSAIAKDVARAGREDTLRPNIKYAGTNVGIRVRGTGCRRKKSRICFVLGLDGSRQKFRLDANGDVFIRWNDQFMKGLPARDTPRIEMEKQPVHFRFDLPSQPVERHIEEESIPTCITTWERDLRPHHANRLRHFA